MMTSFPIVLNIISYCFYLNKQTEKQAKGKSITRKLVNDGGHSGILVAKGYGCEAAGWEFKSELDLLLLMLCEDNKLSWF